MKSWVPQLAGSNLSAEELLASQEGLCSLEFVRCVLVGYSVSSGPEVYMYVVGGVTIGPL